MNSNLTTLAPGALLFLLLFLSGLGEHRQGLPGGAAMAQEGKKECLWEPMTLKGAASALTLVTESGEKLKVEVPEGCTAFTKYECSQWKGPGGAEAVHFKAFEKKGGQAFEAFAAVASGAPKLVWSGVTGLSGEYGERQGVFLDYEPPATGSKDLYPVLYRLDERVQLCGFGLVPLDVKMYDPKTSSFRAVTFDRLRRWKRGETKGWGSGEGAAAPKYAKPLGLTGSFAPAAPQAGEISPGDFLIFESSSSSIGADGKPAVGVPPFSLGDGSGETGWVEGSGGDGSGEFVTIKTISSYVPIKALELLLAPGGPAKNAKTYGALKKLSITTDSGKVFTVSVPADPRKFPDKMVVVQFPEPLGTKCLSLVIDEVWPASPAGGNHTFIGEVTAETAIEDGEALAKVAASLRKAGKGKSLQQILKAMAPEAAVIVADAWDSLDDETRRWLIDNTPKNLLSSEAGLPLAGKQLLWSRSVKKEVLLINLMRSFEIAGLPMLTWYDSPPAPEMKQMATLMLCRQGFDEAAGDLVGYFLLEGSAGAPKAPLWDEIDLLPIIAEGMKQPLRGRSDVAAGSGAASPPVKKDWCSFLKDGFYGAGGSAGGAQKEFDPRKMIALLYPMYLGGQVDCAALLARSLWDGHEEFETRYYVLDLYGKLVTAGCASCQDQFGEGGLIPQALGLGEEPLKVTALEVVSMARGIEGSIAATIEKLLGDASPLVRAKAVSVFSSLDFKGGRMEKAVLKLAMDDFWPEVRKEAVMAAFKIKDIAEVELVDLLSDESPDVRKHAIRLVVDRGKGSKAIGKALIASAAGEGVRWDVKEESSLAFGRLCIAGFESKLEDVVEDGLYPNSTEAEISASVGAITSLGMLGWKDAVDVLKIAVLPGLREEIRLSAVEALGSIGGAEATEILGALVKDAEQSVRDAASAALDRIKAGVGPACKKTP